MKKLLLALVAVASSASALAQSAVPNLMSYQSRVADAAGVPLGNTTPVNRIVLFRIYDSPNLSAPANRLYSEQQTVTIAAGEFSVLIGSGTAISTETTNAFSTLSAAVFGGATRYLGVTVDDGDGNPLNDPEMSPRQQIVGTPFAFRAQTAEAVALGGVTALSLANNAVTTAAIAPAAVTNSQLAPAAVDTTQVADNAVTLEKHAANSVDSSKIVDGSVALADLSPALQAAVASKPSYTYNQGLASNAGNVGETIVFPIDVSDLGVDGEVVISYVGYSRNSGATVSFPSAYAGRVRVVVPNFTAVGGGFSSLGATGGLSYSTNYAAATSVAQDAANVFFAESQGPNSESRYSSSGSLNSASMAVTVASPPASSLAPLMPINYNFPTRPTTLGVIWSSGTASTGSPVYAPFNSGSQGFNTYYYQATPIGAAVSFSMTAPTYTGAGSAQAGGINSFTVNQIPLIYIFHYYPGTIPASGIQTGAQANVSTNASAGGPNQTLPVASVITGTNKLTVTTTNPHTIQVGDTVVIAGMTGTPAANASYTVAAVPDRTKFEVTLNGATGTYSAGTVTHTPRYYKYRFWVSVAGVAGAARVTVSDK